MVENCVDTYSYGDLLQSDPNAAQNGGPGRPSASTGDGRVVRYLPLPVEAMPAVTRHRRNSDPSALAIGRPFQDGDPSQVTVGRSFQDTEPFAPATSFVDTTDRRAVVEARSALRGVRGKHSDGTFANAARRTRSGASTAALRQSSPQRTRPVGQKPRRKRRRSNRGLEEDTGPTPVEPSSSHTECLSMTDIPWMGPLERPWVVNTSSGLAEAILLIERTTRASKDAIGCMDIEWQAKKGSGTIVPALVQIAFRNMPACLFDLVMLVPKGRKADPGRVCRSALSRSHGSNKAVNVSGKQAKASQNDQRDNAVLAFIDQGKLSIRDILGFAKVTAGKATLAKFGICALGEQGARGAVARLVDAGTSVPHHHHHPPPPLPRLMGH